MYRITSSPAGAGSSTPIRRAYIRSVRRAMTIRARDNRAACRFGRGAHLATHCARVSSSRGHDEIEEARPREAQEPVRHHIAVLQLAPVVLLFLRRPTMQSQTPSRHTKLSHNKTARLQGACLETDVVEKVRQERGPATHAEVAGVVHEPRRRRERQPQEDVVIVARVCLCRQGM